ALDSNGQAGIEIADEASHVNRSLGKAVHRIGGDAKGTVRHRNHTGIHCGKNPVCWKLRSGVNVVETAGLRVRSYPPRETEARRRPTMCEAECKNEIIRGTAAVCSVRSKTVYATSNGVVRDKELVLQEFKINISGPIVALAIGGDHHPSMSVGVLAYMKQGVVYILLVAHRIERPAPSVGVIVYFVTASKVVVGAA